MTKIVDEIVDPEIYPWHRSLDREEVLSKKSVGRG